MTHAITEFTLAACSSAQKRDCNRTLQGLIINQDFYFEVSQPEKGFLLESVVAELHGLGSPMELHYPPSARNCWVYYGL